MSKEKILIESLEKLPSIGSEGWLPLTLEELPPITGEVVELVFTDDDDLREGKA